MGGRGAFLESGGFSTPNLWHSISYIYGIKILVPRKEGKSLSLPERSNTPSTSYLIYKPDGTFKQMRIFDSERKPVYDIDYHIVNGKLILHKHIYKNGIRGAEHIPLTQEEHKKYDKFLKRGNSK